MWIKKLKLTTFKVYILMAINTFPDFNIYSIPLLFLSVQSLIFVISLVHRYYRYRAISDLLLAGVIMITCYQSTAYTIGFLGWYDTYPTTKVNYFLLEMWMVLAPLLYFYARSVVCASFKFSRIHIVHFVPWLVYFLGMVAIFFVDFSSASFNDVQNGRAVTNFQWNYLDPLISLITMSQMIVYLFLSFQLYYLYSIKIKDFFSNTYQIELSWLRNFLVVYTLLFIFISVQTIINKIITPLSWKQEWWYYLLSSIAVLYVAIKGYFTPVLKLKALGFTYENFSFRNTEFKSKLKSVAEDITPKFYDEKVKAIETYMLAEHPFIDVELTLVKLAKQLDISRDELSETINNGLGKNFNDFVNGYRVDAVKKFLTEKKSNNLSLEGVAYECGFNSKATFYRAFKKQTQISPSQYLSGLKL